MGAIFENIFDKCLSQLLIGMSDDFLLLSTANLLISSPQVKSFMILTHTNINLE